MAKTSDRLSEYLAKRDFSRTDEPRGEPAKARDSDLCFVVQKHAARRLHYDFRLEWKGVLLSWAVTRGPSADPGEKRLAVRTEDHPLSYAEFEGAIPKKEYGGGTVMLWDRGTWLPEGDPDEGLKDGKLSFSLKGERMKGGWALVRMKGNEKRENWLLIKERDPEASGDADALTKGNTRSIATGRSMDEIAEGNPDGPQGKRTRQRPAFRDVQLATLFDAAPAGDDWLHETKFDGYRALAAIGKGGTRLYTRSGQDWTDRFAALEGAFAPLTCSSALIDGEVMAAKIEGSAFSSLQSALSNGGPLVFYAFDLLSVDGRDLTAEPLSERKDRLAQVLKDLPADAPLRMSEHVIGHGPELFAQACDRGAEGIVSKRIDAPYRGRRTKAWRKIKCTRRQEFVIGGLSPSDKAGRPFSSLLIGTYDGKQLRYRGRIGTGFAQADFDRLSGSMSPRKTAPFEDVPDAVARHARWVRPELVAEVAFTEFTADDHVRHGSYLGLREDKSAQEVTLESGRGKAMNDSVLGIEISNGDRQVFPDAGCTKLDIAEHYARVGKRMIALAGRRPLSLFRCPGGLGECFFQKHGHGGMPDALSHIDIREKDGEIEDYLYATRPESLVAAAQMGAVEFHIWGARTDRLERPDRLVFDLDPDEALDWAEVRAAAIEVRDLLDLLGLRSGAIVTGGKGIHVWTALRRTRDWDVVKLFARTFAHALAEKSPDRYTATMSKARRKGRIFVDWLRNERGATAIAPYSLRARKSAPVAVPVTWDELEGLKAANGFRIGDMAARLDNACPAIAVRKDLQSLSNQVIDRLQDWAAED
ncbi:DNA ligase D [Defluviimonas sp. WL0002]|uniref:DNA ligase (ATP) n=2 Tax=Albidovulum marisflavi TaxID=2984159 RepID=A0ABT2ZAX5_9RHOB|nr:DNA ligase D [Defluviimonas sp. WL0002]MCV2868289.1 DNA ligase D [Defluviimonas sp. WL0002]